jgi:hypothetical protein
MVSEILRLTGAIAKCTFRWPETIRNKRLSREDSDPMV